MFAIEQVQRSTGGPVACFPVRLAPRNNCAERHAETLTPDRDLTILKQDGKPNDEPSAAKLF